MVAGTGQFTCASMACRGGIGFADEDLETRTSLEKVLESKSSLMHEKECMIKSSSMSEKDLETRTSQQLPNPNPIDAPNQPHGISQIATLRLGSTSTLPRKKVNLKSWEVNFKYIEEGIQKNALVKLRLCPKCSDKLNYTKNKEKKALLKLEKKAEKTERKLQKEKVKLGNLDTFNEKKEKRIFDSEENEGPLKKIQTGKEPAAEDLTKETDQSNDEQEKIDNIQIEKERKERIEMERLGKIGF